MKQRIVLSALTALTALCLPTASLGAPSFDPSVDVSSGEILTVTEGSFTSDTSSIDVSGSWYTDDLVDELVFEQYLFSMASTKLDCSVTTNSNKYYEMWQGWYWSNAASAAACDLIRHTGPYRDMMRSVGIIDGLRGQASQSRVRDKDSSGKYTDLDFDEIGEAYEDVFDALDYPVSSLTAALEVTVGTDGADVINTTENDAKLYEVAEVQVYSMPGIHCDPGYANCAPQEIDWKYVIFESDQGSVSYHASNTDSVASDAANTSIDLGNWDFQYAAAATLDYLNALGSTSPGRAVFTHLSAAALPWEEGTWGEVQSAKDQAGMFFLAVPDEGDVEDVLSGWNYALPTDLNWGVCFMTKNHLWSPSGFNDEDTYLLDDDYAGLLNNLQSAGLVKHYHLVGDGIKPFLMNNGNKDDGWGNRQKIGTMEGFFFAYSADDLDDIEDVDTDGYTCHWE